MRSSGRFALMAALASSLIALILNLAAATAGPPRSAAPPRVVGQFPNIYRDRRRGLRATGCSGASGSFGVFGSQPGQQPRRLAVGEGQHRAGVGD